MTHPVDPLLEKAGAGLIEAGHRFYSRGWLPATSGNLSVKLSSDLIAITVSGAHKGNLTASDIMTVDRNGKPVRSDRRPSAETGLHTAIYSRFPDVGSVLHTHSVSATLLSRFVGAKLLLSEYELLKAFPGIGTHETQIELPVFPNDQEIGRLAKLIGDRMDSHPTVAPGFLIEGHGLYAWGRDIAEAQRHVEAFEFLLECELSIKKAGLR